jgi:hypothetical protein
MTATASGPAESQPAGEPVGTSRPPAGQRTEAPIQVPLSDRPTTVSQPGSSGLGTKPNRPAAEKASTPHAGQQASQAEPTLRPAGMDMPQSSTSEIQARLQAAMRPSGRPSTGLHPTPVGDPSNRAATTGSTSESPAVNQPPATPGGQPAPPPAVQSQATSQPPAPGTSRTAGAPVGVAGRRDYPATPRRENAESSRGSAPADAPTRAQAPSLGVMPTAAPETPATRAAAGKPLPGPKSPSTTAAATKAEGDRDPAAEKGSAAESGGAPDAAASKTAARGHAHIAEQRVDADRLPPADAAGKAGDPTPSTAKTNDKAKGGADAVITSPKAAKAGTEKGNSEPARAEIAHTEKAQTRKAQPDNAPAEKALGEKALGEKALAEKALGERALAEKALTGGAKPGKPSPEMPQPKQSSAREQPKKPSDGSSDGKPSVPGARLSTYAEEAAELLAGLSADRRRRKPSSDESTADPAPGDGKAIG